MASTFKNAGLDVGVLDDSTGDIYTASGSGVTAVIHAVYISNLSATNVAKVNVKVTIDGGSTFRHVGRSLEVDVNNTLVLKNEVDLKDLKKKTKAELEKIGRKVGIELDKRLTKDKLIKQIKKHCK